MALVPQYAVILDAGSSGTRAYVYTWNMIAGGIPNVVSAGDIQGSKANVGLATLAPQLIPTPEYRSLENIHRATRAAVAAYLDPLLHAVERFLENRGVIAGADTIPLFILATGGMRWLKQENYAAYEILRGAIIGYINATAYHDPFYDTISGEDEALYGWVAANHVQGRFQHGRQTHGFLEMGGESSQFAAAVHEGQAGNYLGQLRKVVVRGRPFHVFVKSWMGLGAESSWKRHEAVLREVNERQIPDPCLPRGFKLPLPGTANNIHGEGNASQCFRRCIDLITCPNQACQDGNLCILQPGGVGCLLRSRIIENPNIPFNQQPFLGASIFYRVTRGLLGGADANFNQFWANAATKAEKPFAQLKDENPREREYGFRFLLKSLFTAGLVMSTLFLGIGIPMPRHATVSALILAWARALRAIARTAQASQDRQDRSDRAGVQLLDTVFATGDPNLLLAVLDLLWNPNDANLQALMEEIEGMPWNAGQAAGVRLQARNVRDWSRDANRATNAANDAVVIAENIVDQLVLAAVQIVAERLVGVAPGDRGAAAVVVAGPLVQGITAELQGEMEPAIAPGFPVGTVDRIVNLAVALAQGPGVAVAGPANFQPVGVADWTQGRIVLHVNNYVGAEALRTRIGWEERLVAAPGLEHPAGAAAAAAAAAEVAAGQAVEAARAAAAKAAVASALVQAELLAAQNASALALAAQDAANFQEQQAQVAADAAVAALANANNLLTEAQMAMLAAGTGVPFAMAVEARDNAQQAQAESLGASAQADALLEVRVAAAVTAGQVAAEAAAAAAAVQAAAPGLVLGLVPGAMAVVEAAVAVAVRATVIAGIVGGVSVTAAGAEAAIQ